MMRYHMMFYVMITVYTVLAGKCGLLVKMLCQGNELFMRNMVVFHAYGPVWVVVWDSM
ncbi:hypothetical protein KPHES18084_20660 [Corynebacterium ulcerans]|nr:hypothetical protein D881_06290 [Corynebacterium ulcerans NCTC 12077]STC75651.1 Uncharacterised protein [Corynebacterium ulcerans]BDV25480.1 hypothetical protein CULTSU28_07280 [Corynebacterium ulcerans]BDV25871.1 hypothetical protein CULTSU28_11190 [Corynebacterium ulcerans]BDV26593.1 hypothetical protein CULTSU28_18410 [Corynebacterium ulcerans]